MNKSMQEWHEAVGDFMLDVTWFSGDHPEQPVEDLIIFISSVLGRRSHRALAKARQLLADDKLNRTQDPFIEIKMRFWEWADAEIAPRHEA